jgi:hypothetical protein
MKRKIDKNKIYLIKDGFISVWEFMEQTGTIDRMKQNGITINPTHSFELLKKTRLEIFEKVKQNFIEERKIKKLLTSDFEIGCLYYSWLKREFEIIKNWLLDKPSNSDQYEIGKYKQFLELEMIQTESEINPQPKQTETKTDKLKSDLGDFGFFELPKVKQLSEPNKQKLIELISKNDIPYKIAMFDYLGFLKYLKDEHFRTNDNLFKGVSKWLGFNERTIKGNYLVLNEFSKENRKRFTADQQKQTVQKNYEALK